MKMPSKREIKTHDAYCQRVCLLCFNKIKPSTCGRPLKEKTWRYIEKYIISGLDKKDSRLPKVLCMGCNARLNEYSRGIFVNKIDLFDHKKLTEGPTMITREHTCIVCEIGSSLFGKGVKKT